PSVPPAHPASQKTYSTATTSSHPQTAQSSRWQYPPPNRVPAAPGTTPPPAASADTHTAVRRPAAASRRMASLPATPRHAHGARCGSTTAAAPRNHRSPAAAGPAATSPRCPPARQTRRGTQHDPQPNAGAESPASHRQRNLYHLAQNEQRQPPSARDTAQRRVRRPDLPAPAP